MDLRKVKKLIELLESSSLSEIEISEGEESIRITKKSDLEENTTNKSQETIEINQNIHQQSTKNQSTSSGIEIKSPMVGVFYESPNPGGKPYVSIGSNVNVGRPQVGVSQKINSTTTSLNSPSGIGFMKWPSSGSTGGQLGNYGDAYYYVRMGNDSNSYIDCSADL